MTPFPTPAEVAALQDRARVAWAKAQKAEGLERLRLINEAFPFAITGGPSSLKFMWHFKEKKWTAMDGTGFITLIEPDDIATMLIAVGMDADRPGAFRELVEGKKRAETPAPPPKKEKKPVPSLSELGLTRKDQDPWAE